MPLTPLPKGEGHPRGKLKIFAPSSAVAGCSNVSIGPGIFATVAKDLLSQRSFGPHQNQKNTLRSLVSYQGPRKRNLRHEACPSTKRMLPPAGLLPCI